jgi:hypothetical protein
VPAMSTNMRPVRRDSSCRRHTYSPSAVIETPLWKELTFHHFGLILSATFGTIAVVIAFFLIMRHANHYSKPYEQKQYVRRATNVAHQLTPAASSESWS